MKNDPRKTPEEMDMIGELSDDDLEAVVGGLANEEMIRNYTRKFRAIFWDERGVPGHTDPLAGAPPNKS